ncbi:uncharacterized protein LOC21401254 [Morus notabilis]|uniref:uncharacterized protein LOC21401254 n=1 Tax=Morus notabilis TaxID=981085 RepID=UPI000CECEAB8|nr:uncharacterized protein LOC21401254 [Morus notabilis]
MQYLSQSQSKVSNYYSRLTSLLIISSCVCTLYLLIALLLARSKLLETYSSTQEHMYEPTSLEHIVFGIASTKDSWLKRKDYVKMWWKPAQMRGCVFLEQGLPNEHQNLSKDTSLPPVCISEDTSWFRYTYRGGFRSLIRVARVVSETVALNHSDVRWFVFGDDDTVFFPENLVKTLSKYDHGLWYYIGTNSELYEANRYFGFGMAFQGAGFAITYPLARVLAKVLDSCLERYPHLYGSDSRIYSCLAELGVGLTLEPGFHQLDIRGDVFGLLASHPVRPLVSLHHLDHTDPIFPNMTASKALQHFFKAANVDPQRLLQQTICYDRWFSWTIVVSWGYAVQIYGNHVFLPDVLHVPETFKGWRNSGNLSGLYTLTTKELHPDRCRRPTVFFLDNVASAGWNGIKTTYQKSYVNCSYDSDSPRKLDEIRVFSHKLELDIKQLQAPRRQCCDVLTSSSSKVMDIAIRECKEEELIRIHP